MYSVPTYVAFIVDSLAPSTSSKKTEKVVRVGFEPTPGACILGTHYLRGDSPPLSSTSIYDSDASSDILSSSPSHYRSSRRLHPNVLRPTLVSVKCRYLHMDASTVSRALSPSSSSHISSLHSVPILARAISLYDLGIAFLVLD